MATLSPVLCALCAALVLSAAAASVAASGVVDAAVPGAPRCLPRLWEDPGIFERCKKRACFLFAEDEPYTSVQDAARADQSLFPCGSGRGGVLAVLNETGAGALCVWAGPRCSVSALPDFLERTARTHPRHRFAVAGLLMEVPSHVSEALIPSASLVDSTLIIVGPPRTPLLLHLLHSLVRGLPVLAAALAVYAAAYTVFSWACATRALFAPGWAIPRVQGRLSKGKGGSDSHTLLSSDSEVGKGDAQEAEPDSFETEGLSDGSSFQGTHWVHHIARICIAVMFVLFFEVSLATVASTWKSREGRLKLSRSSRSDLSKFAVLKGSAIEEIWQKTVDPEKTFKAPTYPWYRCASSSECFEKVMGRNSGLNYVVTYDMFGKDKLRILKAREGLIRYKTDRRLHACGAGLLYGKAVPAPERRKIDKTILELREVNKLRQMLDINHWEGMPSRTPLFFPAENNRLLILALVSLVFPTLAMCAVIALLMP